MCLAEVSVPVEDEGLRDTEQDGDDPRDPDHDVRALRSPRAVGQRVADGLDWDEERRKIGAQNENAAN